MVSFVSKRYTPREAEAEQRVINGENKTTNSINIYTVLTED